MGFLMNTERSKRTWALWFVAACLIVAGLGVAVYLGLRGVANGLDLADPTGRRAQSPAPPPPSEKLADAPGPDNTVKSLPPQPEPAPAPDRPAPPPPGGGG